MQRHASHAPPRLATWLLGRYFARHRHPELIGDLYELFDLRRRTRGRVRSLMWYWAQVVTSLRSDCVVSGTADSRDGHPHGLGSRSCQGRRYGSPRRHVGLGVVIGLSLSVVATRPIAGLLHGVSSTDTATFAGVAVLFAAVALVASYVPARRAANVGPTVALRYELRGGGEEARNCIRSLPTSPSSDLPPP